MAQNLQEGKERRPAEELAEGQGNIEWLVEQGGYKYWLWLRDQL